MAVNTRLITFYAEDVVINKNIEFPTQFAKIKFDDISRSDEHGENLPVHDLIEYWATVGDVTFGFNKDGLSIQPSNPSSMLKITRRFGEYSTPLTIEVMEQGEVSRSPRGWSHV